MQCCHLSRVPCSIHTHPSIVNFFSSHYERVKYITWTLSTDLAYSLQCTRTHATNTVFSFRISSSFCEFSSFFVFVELILLSSAKYNILCKCVRSDSPNFFPSCVQYFFIQFRPIPYDFVVLPKTLPICFHKNIICSLALFGSERIISNDTHRSYNHPLNVGLNVMILFYF